MRNNLPILIPVKGHSERCHRKNYRLLPYTASYLYGLGLQDRACVITDAEDLQRLAFSLGLKVHLETRHPRQDELTSCWNYAVAQHLGAFFLCPVTQPFRGHLLIPRMQALYEGAGGDWDFLTTISAMPDRRQFFVRRTAGEYQFVHESKNRKGCDCPGVYMIDGALYLIKTSFLQQVMVAKDANEAFWRGRFTCVENEAPFMDIDTVEDMQRFEFLMKYFNKRLSRALM